MKSLLTSSLLFISIQFNDIINEQSKDNPRQGTPMVSGPEKSYIMQGSPGRLPLQAGTYCLQYVNTSAGWLAGWLAGARWAGSTAGFYLVETVLSLLSGRTLSQIKHELYNNLVADKTKL